MVSNRTAHAVVGLKGGTLTAVALSSLFVAAAANPADALTIKPIYDSSITSLSNAATIESAFQAVVNVFDSEFSTPITVKIGVSFGSVDGQSIPSGDVSTSLTPLLEGYEYTDVTGALQDLSSATRSDKVLASVVANLPANDPAGMDNYDIPYAEGQALGFLPASIGLDSGFVGFKNVAFDFSEANGVSAGSYDFQGLAAHEISEVLGRISGLPSSGSAQYSTPFDILRYTAPGVSSFSSSAHAYFSINGGATDLGNFNYSGGGDRGDWLGSTNDSFNAYLKTGVVEALSGNDLTALDALGYGAWSTAGTQGASFKTTAFAIGGGSAVPEPSAWAMFLVGFGCVGAGIRKREMAISAASGDTTKAGIVPPARSHFSRSLLTML